MEDAVQGLLVPEGLENWLIQTLDLDKFGILGLGIGKGYGSRPDDFGLFVDILVIGTADLKANSWQERELRSRLAHVWESEGVEVSIRRLLPLVWEISAPLTPELTRLLTMVRSLWILGQ
jgi:hypothetical protein